MKQTALLFTLLPGAIQLYYGDETSRENDKGGGIDLEQGLRSDMNFPADVSEAPKWAEGVASLSKDYSANSILAGWQKAGQFRLRNPAVVAGEQTELDDGSYCRQFADPAKGINNSVVIHYGEASEVLTGKCFADVTVLQEALTGKEYTVKGGKVAVKVQDAALLEVKR